MTSPVCAEHLSERMSICNVEPDDGINGGMTTNEHDGAVTGFKFSLSTEKKLTNIAISCTYFRKSVE